MVAGDLAAVSRVAAQSMLNPWNRGQFATEMNISSGLRLVADNGTVCGYFIGRALAGEAEILQLAVLPSCQRQGIGSRLLALGLLSLAQQRVQACFLEVRRKNTSALLLYRQAGFRRIGIRENYYRHPVDDAVIMQKTIAEDSNDADNS